MGFLFNGDPEGSTWVSVNQNLTPGEWYHVAGTFDGTTIRCYLNGIETDTNLLSAIKSGNATLFIGQDGWGNIFNGIVDELKIYNRALTVDEVQADYEAGLNGPAKSLIGTVTPSPNSAEIAGANVTLATLEGIEIASTTINGNYKFTEVASCSYHLTSKPGYWPDSDPVTVTTEEPSTADLLLCRKGDLNNNGDLADEDNLTLQENVSVGLEKLEQVVLK